MKTLEEQNEQLQKKLEKAELKIVKLTQPLSIVDLYETIDKHQGNFKQIVAACIPMLVNTKEAMVCDNELTYIIMGSGDRHYTIEVKLYHEFDGFWATLLRKKSLFVIFTFEDSNDVFGSNMSAKITDQHLVRIVADRIISRNAKRDFRKMETAFTQLKKLAKDYGR
jgi:hypothetical protein